MVKFARFNSVMINKKFILALAFSFILSSSPQQAIAFGNNVGEYCWRADSGDVIRLQVTQLGNFFNLNGTVRIQGDEYPAYGTGFHDIGTDQYILGYTVVKTERRGFTTESIVLEPSAHFGTRTVYQDSMHPSDIMVHLIDCP